MPTLHHSLLLALCLTALSCAPNIIGQLDAGEPQDAGAAMDAGQPLDAGTPQDAGVGPYPAGPYGVSVNRVIQNFTFPGYFTTGTGVRITTLSKTPALDLQAIRNAVDATGKPFKLMLLDISAGWCPPCNQEAEDLGLNGTKAALPAQWAAKGGLFVTVLAEGYDGNAHDAPVDANLNTWANQHATQTTLVIDPGQRLIAEGINPSAFPTNLVIDLRTMKITSAWYGLDVTYQRWEAALNAVQ